MSWRQKRLLPYAATLIVILGLLGMLGFLVVRHVDSLGVELYEHPYRVSVAALRIQSNIQNIQAATMRVMLQGTPAAVDEYLRVSDELEIKVNEDFVLISSRFLGDRQWVDEAWEAFSYWSAFRDELIMLHQTGTGREAVQILLEFGDHRASFALEKLNKVTNFAGNKANDFRRQAENAGSWAERVVLSGLLLSLLLALVVFRKIIAIERELKDSNIILEAKVAERTQELGTANEQLTAFNEELTASNEELSAAHEELTAMNEESVAMNEELTAMNEQLQDLNATMAEEVEQRRMTEQRLRASEDRYQRLFGELTVGFLVCAANSDAAATVSDYRILEANRAFRSMAHVSETDLIAATIGKLTVSWLKGMDRALTAVAFGGGTLEREVSDNGEDRHWHIKAYSPGSGLAAVLCTEITHRKRAEVDLYRAKEELEKKVLERTAALAEANRSLEQEIKVREVQRQQLALAKDYAENLVNTANVMVVVLDAVGEMLVFNAAAEAVTGYTYEELRGRNWFEVLVPRERYPAVWEEFSRLQAGGLPQSYSNPVLTKNGEERTIRWQNSQLREYGKITGTVSFGIDVTEQIRAETALREKEEWYRTMMEYSWDAIVLVDYEDKTVLETNRRWRDILGYSTEDLRGLTAYDLVAESTAAIDERYGQLRQMGHSPPALSHVRAKNGAVIEMERVGSVLRIGERDVLLFCSRDLSEERRLQYQIRQDMLLAGEVQKNLLPGDFNDTCLEVATIYQPYNLVSGDFFDYGWSEDYLRFSGFVLDVSGHGVASSLLGIVVSTYFRDALNSPMNLTSRLNWVNRQVSAYFGEDSYGAAIYFEFDFLKRTLTYAGAGIHTLLTASNHLPNKVLVPGSLIGVSDDPEFTQWTMPFEPGDAFYFLSDGIYERLTGEEALVLRDFPRAVQTFGSLAAAATRRDDCSGVCVRIKEQEKFPLVLKYHRHGRNNRIRTAVLQLFNRVAGDEAGKLNVAFGEALTNAVRQSMDVRVRINLLGDRLMIRVRDQGGGFAGNARVAAIRQDVDGSMFEQILLAEGGRGIMIMVSWMDQVIYNHQGNEVMLVKRLKKKKTVSPS